MNFLVIFTFIFLFFTNMLALANPDFNQSLKNISEGPRLKNCKSRKEPGSNSRVGFIEVLDDEEGSESIISKLLHIEPIKLDEKSLKMDYQIFISIDIPAYSGKQSEQIRTKSNPYDLQKFFQAKGKDIYDYSNMEKLEIEVVDHVTPEHGRIKPAFRKKIQESIMIMDYAHLVRTGKFKQADNFLKSSFKGKSTEEKISFIGSLLKKLNDNYNKVSRGQGVGTKDISMRKLAKAIFVNNDGSQSEAELKVGVCRHIHQFAVRAARQMGLKMAFGITYPTATGYHATMVVSDPKNPGRTYKLNYQGVKRDDSSRGHSALEQDEGKASSNGITFHMWGKNDQPVYFTPSEKGLVLAQIAGEDLSNFDPNIRPTAKKVISGVKLGKSLLKVFHAKTSVGEGENISGLGLVRRVDFNRFITGNYGLVGYSSDKVNRTGSHVPNSVTRHESSSNGIYFYIDHDFQVNLVERNELSLKIFSRFALRGTGFFSKYKAVKDTIPLGEGSVLLGDGSGQIISGLEAKIGRKLTLTGTSDVSGQISDITAQGGGFNLYARRFSFESKFSTFPKPGLKVSNINRFNLIPLEGNNIMIGSSDLAIGNSNSSKEIVLGVLYPISKIVPAYIPGSKATIEATVRASFANGMLGFSLSAYIVPGVKFKTASKPKLEETQMRTKDFTAQEKVKSPASVKSVDTEVGVGFTGELRF